MRICGFRYDIENNARITTFNADPPILVKLGFDFNLRNQDSSQRRVAKKQFRMRYCRTHYMPTWKSRFQILQAWSDRNKLLSFVTLSSPYCIMNSWNVEILDDDTVVLLVLLNNLPHWTLKTTTSSRTWSSGIRMSDQAVLPIVCATVSSKTYCLLCPTLK